MRIKTRDYTVHSFQNYRKDASISTSHLEASFTNYRLFMKRKFNVYLLWPFDMWFPN